MDFNPFTPEFRANPYHAYAELRREGAVFRSEALGMYVVSRYDEVVHVLKNPAVFSSAQSMNIMVGGQPRVTVINADPPVHARLRSLVNGAFTPRMVADMEPRIREITGALLDRVVARGETDLVADLAVPLPVAVIAEIMGIEPERHDDFKRWSSAAVSGGTVGTADDRVRLEREMNELVAYFEQIVDERRRTPREDLMSALVRAETGEHPLTASEVIAFCILLLIAGNETTTNLIGNAVLALLEHPAQHALVLADPTLIPNFVEEALRYDSPVQFLPRSTTRDVELGGVVIPNGSTVFPSFASANRNEWKFPDPDAFDITRNTQGHLAFGHGIHFCLGAPLARLEARVALEQLLLRLPDLKRSEASAPERLPSPILRGLAHLPLNFRASQVAI
jgi:cytochrome P450